MTQNFSAARTNMVENQVRTSDVTDLAIQDAMRVVRRELFCPPGKAHLAYAEIEVEYAPGWFLLQPRDVSKLLQAIYSQPGERALAIAAPYAAAVLARMGLGVDLLQPPGAAAGVARAALHGVIVKISEGEIGPHIPVVKPGDAFAGSYDVVVCEGAVTKAPEYWLQSLDVGGRLGVVERSGPAGKALIYVRGPRRFGGASRNVRIQSTHDAWLPAATSLFVLKPQRLQRPLCSPAVVNKA